MIRDQFARLTPPEAQSMDQSPVKIAIIGLGTVGTGVAQILNEHPDRIRRRSGRAIEIRHAVVRDLDRFAPQRLLASDRSRPRISIN